MGTGTAVLFKTRISKTHLRGKIIAVKEFKSKWGDRLYTIELENGKVRIAFPDEVAVAT